MDILFALDENGVKVVNLLHVGKLQSDNNVSQSIPCLLKDTFSSNINCISIRQKAELPRYSSKYKSVNLFPLLNMQGSRTI